MKEAITLNEAKRGEFTHEQCNSLSDTQELSFEHLPVFFHADSDPYAELDLSGLYTEQPRHSFTPAKTAHGEAA